jgi:hypothetical protein
VITFMDRGASPFGDPRIVAGAQRFLRSARNLDPELGPIHERLQCWAQEPHADPALDSLIARLPARHQAAIVAAYVHAARPAAERAAHFLQLAHAAGLRGSATAFQIDLDRARWALRFVVLYQPCEDH